MRIVLGLLLALLAAGVHAQVSTGTTVRASIDRSQPAVNETFVYILRAEGQVRGEPDVTVLAQLFDVLDERRSSRIVISNGQASQVSEWIYTLMPRTPGDVLIPPIEWSGEFSNAVELEVLPQTAAGDTPDDIFLEAEFDPAEAYAQAQVVYTLRLYVGARTGRATITPPRVTGGEAIVERLGDDREYRATRGGREFQVIERRYAIFPQQAGTLTVGPAAFDAMVLPSRGFSRMERFTSEALSLEVAPPVPPPPSYPNAAWLPATELTLEEQWSAEPPSLEVGVPTTRTLTIAAEGLLETQLPELQVPQASGVRQYADRPELERTVTADGLISVRTERYAVLPQAAGEAEVPGVELPWFNVVDGRWEVAILPSRRLDVAPGAAVPAPVDVPAQAPAPAAVPVPAETGRFWPTVSAVLAAGWVATLLLWWRSTRANGTSALLASASSTVSTRKRSANRRLLRRLRAACERGAADDARELLLEWAALRFPDAPPRSLGALAERLPARLAAEVAALEAALYGRQRGGWDGGALAGALAEIDSVDRRAGPAKGDDDLLPLYR